MTSNTLQAAVCPYRHSLLQEATTFVNGNLYFHGSFNGEDYKATTHGPAELQHHSCELQASFRTPPSRTRNLQYINLPKLFEKASSFFMMEQFPQIKFQFKSLLSRVKSTLQHFVPTLLAGQRPAKHE